MFPPTARRLLACLLVASLLTACDSAEERAESHFQKAAELFAAGDVARAVIELRNVFRLDTDHPGARQLMAGIEEARGNIAGAYGQYQALTETDPENFEAQRAAARLAALADDWEAAERHAAAAAALLDAGETDPELRAVELGVRYREARGSDPAAAAAVAEEASELLQEQPGLRLARQLVIDDRLARQDWEAALTELDAGLEQDPDEQVLYALRLAVLQQLGRPEAIEAQLRQMIDRFPDDQANRDMLVRWYVSQDRGDAAEDFLRSRIDPEDDSPDARMTLVVFLSQLQGPEAALTEIERILDGTEAGDPNRALYRSVRAGLIFDTGDRAAAIAEMQDILDTAEASDQTRRIKIALARMLQQTGNPVGARALVEEVLAEDTTNVEALKMRASWMIGDDRPEAALVELRAALDQAPRDPAVLTLMAEAHERAGSRELMGEMLALAVEASGGAPAPSLRYAGYLAADERLLPAEGVLVDALRLDPGNLEILAMLGDIYLQLEDWGRAQGVIDALKAQEAEIPETAARNATRNATRDGAKALADRLTARLLAAQSRGEELQAFLEDLAASQDGDNQAAAGAIRMRLARGDTAGALDYLETLLAERPQDTQLRLFAAALKAIEGNPDEAAEAIRAVLTDRPEDERAWMALYNLYRGRGESETARAVLSEARAAVPGGAYLKWTEATELERDGEIEAAIALYEELYEENSAAPVIANNLASLISSFREDDESLQRAFGIARRLRGTEVPQFQDTYGWIAARLGNHEEALSYLEPAAQALPEDPTVRYHLARTYAMAGRDADALEAYRAAQDLLAAGPNALPFGAEVAAEIARLEAAVPQAEN
ncbi:tetratricopeptide repeat protein [Pseudoruegeria sp. HB172150]|uniref:tetratricopeptide repeat protein n=1 Tax=Pseudoruegeria sp. HB172150 TaxID=2721164 RepID=UPI0015550E8B|nr:tetratricopeptide repeat protein [Pseudoruegeria sp. HB172150]